MSFLRSARTTPYEIVTKRLYHHLQSNTNTNTNTSPFTARWNYWKWLQLQLPTHGTRSNTTVTRTMTMTHHQFMKQVHISCVRTIGTFRGNSLHAETENRTNQNWNKRHGMEKRQLSKKASQERRETPYSEDTQTDKRIPTKQNNKLIMMEQMKSIPNLITMTRICGTPIIGYWIVFDNYQWALGGCLIAGFTDWLDGYIAKNYNGTTTLGTYLDPLADKFTITVISICLAYKELLPMDVVSIWILRDIVMMTFTGYYVRKSKQQKLTETTGKRGDLDTRMSIAALSRWAVETTPLKVKPSELSKINTTLQFAAMAAGICQPLFGILTAVQLNYFCWLTAATTVSSSFTYIGGNAFTKEANNDETSTNDVPPRRKQ